MNGEDNSQGIQGNPQEVQYIPQKSNKLFWILGGVLGVFVIILVGVLLFIGLSSNDSSGTQGDNLEGTSEGADVEEESEEQEEDNEDEIVCEESWSCGNWSSCVNSSKTRTCSDTNSCGTFENKSIESENCVVENISEIVCEEDWDCFIEASQDCSESNLIYSTELNFFGAITSGTSLLELKGRDNLGKCIYHQTVLENSASFSEDTKTLLLSQGLMQEEINLLEQEMDLNAKWMINTKQICGFEDSELSGFLTNRREGIFSTDYVDNCESVRVREDKDCTLLSLSRTYDVIKDSQAIFVKYIVGYTTENEISWFVENESIATLASNNGVSNTIYGFEIGNTDLIIIDTVVGNDCKETVIVRVTEESL